MSKTKYKDLTKNTLLFTLSNFGTKILSFLLVPLYTSCLSTTDYGNVDLINTTVALLLPIFTLGIQDAVLRFSLDRECDPNKVISTSCKFIAASSCVLGIIILILYSLEFIHVETRYLIFFFISFLSLSFLNSINAYLKAVEKVLVLVVSSLLVTIINCGLNLFLLLYMKMGVNGYLIASIISSLCGFLYSLIKGKVFSTLKIKFDSKLFKQMLIFSIPLIFNSLSWWLNNASDRYILTYFCGPSANGIYSVSYKIPTILSTLQSIFYSAWSISAIKEFDKEDKDGFSGNIYNLYSGLSIVGCSFVLLFNNLIAKILYANEFYQAWEYVPALLFGTIFCGIGTFEGCFYTAVKQTKKVSITTFIGALVNTVMNFILIPCIGTLGAAVATFIGYFVIWLVRTIDLRRIIALKVNWTKQIVSIILIAVQCILATLGGYYCEQALIFIALMALQKDIISKLAAIIKSKVKKT